jgi:hypothetical protein
MIGTSGPWGFVEGPYRPTSDDSYVTLDYMKKNRSLASFAAQAVVISVVAGVWYGLLPCLLTAVDSKISSFKRESLYWT